MILASEGFKHCRYVCTLFEISDINVNERYVVRRRTAHRPVVVLGKSGMAAIARAHQELLKGHVAIRVKLVE